MSDTVALVTGATRGIGRQVAADLAARGFTVIVSGRDAGAVRSTVAELSDRGDVRALGLGLDVADAGAVAAVPAAVRDAAGRLDVLVNNAAAFVDWTEVASAADLAVARDVMETNLFGPWRMVQVLLPLLRESPHPRIVNVSSGGGSHGDQQFGLTRRGGAAASYGISKAALNAPSLPPSRPSSPAQRCSSTPSAPGSRRPGRGLSRWARARWRRARPRSSPPRCCPTTGRRGRSCATGVPFPGEDRMRGPGMELTEVR